VNPRLSLKTCSTCKTEFMGGTRAIFCPSCRAERIRQRDREKHQRKRAGTLRKISSTDLCDKCGQPYTVNGGYQKFCPICAEIERKSRQRESHLRMQADPVRHRRMIERARAWALSHRERVADALRRSYLRNLKERTERRRSRTGLKLKPLGRVEICPRCLQQFLVTERNQRYCDGCREGR